MPRRLDEEEYCPNCGQYTGGESICPNCGAVLNESGGDSDDDLNGFHEEDGDDVDLDDDL